MLSIITVPFEACDPNEGTVSVGGQDYECSEPLEVYDPDNSGAFASDHVTVMVRGTVLPQPDVIRIVYAEAP